MKVKQLREMIKNLPDDTLVVTPSYDHSFREVDGGMDKIVIEGKYKHLTEYWESGVDYQEPFQVVDALVIGR